MMSVSLGLLASCPWWPFFASFPFDSHTHTYTHTHTHILYSVEDPIYWGQSKGLFHLPPPPAIIILFVSTGTFWVSKATYWLSNCIRLYLKVKVKVAQSCLTLCNPMDLCSHWNSLGPNTGVGSLSLLQGIFPIQGSNPGLPYCRWILYQLSHKWNLRILETVAYPLSSGSSWLRNWTIFLHWFFTNWAMREVYYFYIYFL